ncbi:DUF3492 domain-containing protein [Streptomyces odontomachi]|uniref:DUF3492 domain-containing protein n=1 Tax=Streptomyces odontomachi TaxID=2944940 RepID=UPI00210C1BCE|nr:DUF3492 domain-containing protein [Streptomyces sp. ODS25]
MRVGLITESGYPHLLGDDLLWCDRLVRGLGQHEFDIYALSADARQERAGWVQLPGTVRRVYTAPLWPATDAFPAVRHGRRARRRFLECYAELVAAVCAGGSMGGSGARDAGEGHLRGGGAWWGAHERGGGGGRATGRKGAGGAGASAGTGAGDGATGVVEADRFAAALYALARFAREEGAPSALLRSEAALRVLEHACRAPGALRPAHFARVGDLLAVAAAMERALRPLSFDWYDAPALASADVCHVTSGGAAAVPGLLARHFSGVPLLLSEYGGALCARYLARPAASAPVRGLLTAFYGRLAAETYRQAACIASPGARVRHWQERCGAARGKLRTVHPGLDATCFAEVGEGGAFGGRGGPGESGARGEGGAPGVKGGSEESGTLVWVGSVEPGKDLVLLLHAFAEVHRAEPGTRLRIVGVPAPGPEAADYAARCKALAAQLFPDEAADAYSTGENPVSFEVPDAADGAGARMGARAAGEVEGALGVGRFADACAAGSVVVLSSTVEGFPVSLVAAMFSGRATVSTDVGAVVEVIGGTGLVVPPRNPRALADACLTLLRDPVRRARLGAAARARALELFSVEQNIRAYESMYADLAAHCRTRRGEPERAGSAGRGQAQALTRRAAWAAPAGPPKRPAPSAGQRAPVMQAASAQHEASAGLAASAGRAVHEERVVLGAAPAGVAAREDAR